jgi:serine/threonine-protein kinase SRPK3
MSLNEEFFNKASSESTGDTDYESDSLSVSSDEFDYQIDNIDLDGEVLKSQYAIIKKIGKGSYANVWLAYDITNNKYVAIKVQHPDNYTEGFEEMQFLRKIRLYKCKYINNLLEGFVEIRRDHDNDKKKKYICMVFELLAGNLYDIIQDGTFSKGLPINIVKNMTKQLLIGLDIMHNKMEAYHADLKPENILLKGIDLKNTAIIAAYESLDFSSKYKEMRLEVLKLKNVDPSNKNKVKKVLTSKLKNKIKKQIHINFMEKIKDFVIDESESDSEEDSENDDRCSLDSYNNEESDDDSSSDSDIEEKIDTQFILNPIVKLTDFGSVCYKDDEFEDEFGTRYYRAPEIILGHEYDSSCDVWSLACVMFELLTGDLLFDPIKDKNISRDQYHLQIIQSICGKYSKGFLGRCENKSLYFNKNNKLKCFENIESLNLLDDILINKYNFKKEEIEDMTDLLIQMLNYDPRKRITIKECIGHKWFSN